MKKVLLSVLFLATMGMSAQQTEFESSVKKGRINLAGSLSMIVRIIVLDIRILISGLLLVM